MSYKNISTNEHVKKFVKFLKDHEVTEQGAECTHTTLGTTFGLPYGKYYINDNDLKTFHTLYIKVLSICLKSNIKESPLHIIERPKRVGPILVDLDFRQQNKERCYTIKTIKYIITKYNNLIKKYLKVNNNMLDAFVFEKEKPSHDPKKNNYKDGFHIIYPKISIDASLRYKILEEIQKIVTKENGLKDINYINSDEEVFDKSIVMRNGLTMYGSRKDKSQIYQLTNVFNSKLEKKELDKFSPDRLVVLLSLRVHDQDKPLPFCEKYDTDDFKQELENIYDKYHPNKKKLRVQNKEQKEQNNNRAKNKINKSVNNKKRNNNDDDIEMARKLTALLSEKRASVYESWIYVGWALHNVDDSLLDCFIEFSKKCPEKYEEGCCERIWERAQDDGYTLASLYWWAKEDNPEGYVKLISENFKPIILEAESGTHDDIAKLIYELYKHYYRCVDIGKNIWYEFQKHRWVRIDSAYSLSNRISDEVTNEFAKLASKYYGEICEKKGLDKDDSMEKGKKIGIIINKLKNNGFKEALIKECARRFIDNKFEEKLDNNPFLLGFDNGVYDLKNGYFREGVPDDYVSMTVGYEYKEYSIDDPVVKEIESFFQKVQREDDMRMYILKLISSYLVGTNKDQKFILWTGSGCHAPGTKIIMANGTVKNVEDVKVGEFLMGNDGTPRRVMQLWNGYDDMYEIKQDKAASYVVNRKHRLTLRFHGYHSINFVNNYYDVVWYEFDDINGIIKKNKKMTSYNEAQNFLDAIQKINDKYIPQYHIITLTVEKYLKLNKCIKQLLYGFKSNFNNENNYNNDSQIEVVYVNKGEYHGFELDGNGSYLLYDFTVLKNSNGKSTTIDLISCTLGEYFGVLPITVLTRKRAAAGNATPELANKKGKRFLVIQEPEHDDTIYVGLMKELTGSDWIETRPLYGHPFKYKPQFKLVLVCNKLPSIPSHDGGTWRRLRVSPWESEFVDGQPESPHQFSKDPELTEKLKTWKQAFMWLLLNVYYPEYQKNGLNAPKKVTQYTDKYKKDTDIYWEYISEHIEITNNDQDFESIIELYSSFKNWFLLAYQGTKMGKNCPARKVFINYLTEAKYKINNNKIYGIKFKSDEIAA